MHKSLTILSLATLVLLLGACCKNKQTEQAASLSYQNLDHEPTAAEIADQNNELGFKLWQTLDKEEQNLFYSPYSINTAMGMAYTGARGNTANEMAQSLGYQYSPQQQHRVFAASIAHMNEVKKREFAELHVANALFNAESNLPRLIKTFPETLQQSFGSELFHLDFSQAAKTADFINAWVEKRTNDRIKDIVSERQIADSNDGLVLVNSIYFKSLWSSPFLRKSTFEDKFYTTSSRAEDSYIMLPMMRQIGNFTYAEIPGGQLLEMPFEDPELSMIFMIPDEIEDYDKTLSKANWNSWLEYLKRPRRVEVFLPKFRLEQTLDALPETFKAMGMHEAFSASRADFSGILSPDGENLYISDIVHKAFLEVTEEGTEAAAATQVGFSKLSIEPESKEPPVFRADRPFYCMIIHKAANEILFMGKVLEPALIQD